MSTSVASDPFEVFFNEFKNKLEARPTYGLGNFFEENLELFQDKAHYDQFFEYYGQSKTAVAEDRHLADMRDEILNGAFLQLVHWLFYKIKTKGVEKEKAFVEALQASTALLEN